MKKKVLALIPTRLNSRRLPAKALLPINDMPLIMHVYKRALLSKKIKDVIICCDDKKIFDVVKSHGATDATGFAYSIAMCNKIVTANLIEKIKSHLITVD